MPMDFKYVTPESVSSPVKMLPRCKLDLGSNRLAVQLNERLFIKAITLARTFGVIEFHSACIC